MFVVYQDPYLIQEEINNLKILIVHNPKWGVSIVNTETFPTIEPTTHLSDKWEERSRLAMAQLQVELPWKCIVYNRLYAIASSVLIVAAGFSVLYLAQRGWRYAVEQRRLRNAQVFSTVEKIIDVLQSHAADGGDNFLPVNHVRDLLIPPQDRKRLAGVWAAAARFLRENESRVRTETQVVAGEEFHVWRWLGSLNTSSSSPAGSATRAKTWQGQAFETQVGSVNSLPCSPTPCLKIRGMFDERELQHYAIREAVLAKVAGKCDVLHCDVDAGSNCVYLKCASQSEAAVAYRNLHGWWYDGHLVTVKYLRLERYMQRFPHSPAKGPPYLQPSTATSLANDWTNNDD